MTFNICSCVHRLRWHLQTWWQPGVVWISLGPGRGCLYWGMGAGLKIWEPGLWMLWHSSTDLLWVLGQGAASPWPQTHPPSVRTLDWMVSVRLPFLWKYQLVIRANIIGCLLCAKGLKSSTRPTLDTPVPSRALLSIISDWLWLQVLAQTIFKFLWAFFFFQLTTS